MRAIVFTNDEGGVCIAYPMRMVGQEDMTDAQIEKRYWDEALPRLLGGVHNPKWVDRETIPKDRAERDAWKRDL